ncbi:putative D-methionine transport system permease protein MetI [Peptostreptococcaceae bacterium oral taxon 113 str. W5053]|nr:putative D-methionine transport system permease protein MetI [Peptostreptococcaceae bacterium oral taxon 113 str. W5053]
MEYLIATWETVYMSFASSFFAIVLGLPLGILLVMSQKDGIKENLKLYHVLDVIINVLRSIPILILIVLLFPLSRFLVGRSTGTAAAIVPMFISAAPFVARIMEQSLNEVDKGIIEAARSMGVTDYEMVRHVMVPEALPSIINGVTIVMINLIGYSAIAGVIGGGGLGDLALQFGYYRKEKMALYLSVIIIVLLVQIVQLSGNTLRRALDKRAK